MNDGPPPLYTATVLWSKTIPALLSEEGRTAPAEFQTDAQGSLNGYARITDSAAPSMFARRSNS